MSQNYMGGRHEAVKYLKADHMLSVKDNSIENWDNILSLEILSNMVKDLNPTDVSVIGAGPGVILELLSIIEKESVKNIYLGDYDENNRQLAEKLVKSQAFLNFWTPYIRIMQDRGLISSQANSQFILRSSILQKIRGIYPCDVYDSSVIPIPKPGLVFVPYVLESITSKIDDFRASLKNLAENLSNSSTIVFSLLREASYWAIDLGQDKKKIFETLYLTTEQICNEMQSAGFIIEDCKELELNREGCTGYTFVRVSKQEKILEL